MHIALPRHQNHRRAPVDPLAIPTDVAGVSAGAATISAAPGTATGLLFNTDQLSVSDTVVASQALVPGSATIVITTSATDTSSVAPTDSSIAAASSGPATTASGSTSKFGTGAVIGVSVGALVAVGFLIALIMYCNRRDKEAKQKIQQAREKQAHSPLSDAANARGEKNRKHTSQGQWDKLADGSMNGSAAELYSEKHQQSPTQPTHGHNQSVDMDKMTMFKSSPSMRSIATTTIPSPAPSPTPKENYFNIDPNMFTKDPSSPQPHVRAFAGRVQMPPLSMDGETAVDSFASLKNMRMSGTLNSPTVSVAKSTPPVISGNQHRWDSAEVITLDEHGNPFADGHEERSLRTASRRSSRASLNNPFFGGQERVKARNPFDDVHEQPPVPPVPTVSMYGHQSNGSDATMRDLITALGLPGDAPPMPENEYLDLSRVTSMQPSIMSTTSTIGYEEVLPAFPLPPDARR